MEPHREPEIKKSVDAPRGLLNLRKVATSPLTLAAAALVAIAFTFRNGDPTINPTNSTHKAVTSTNHTPDSLADSMRNLLTISNVGPALADIVADQLREDARRTNITAAVTRLQKAIKDATGATTEPDMLIVDGRLGSDTISTLMYVLHSKTGDFLIYYLPPKDIKVTYP